MKTLFTVTVLQLRENLTSPKHNSPKVIGTYDNKQIMLNVCNGIETAECDTIINDWIKLHITEQGFRAHRWGSDDKNFSLGRKKIAHNEHMSELFSIWSEECEDSYNLLFDVTSSIVESEEEHYYHVYGKFPGTGDQEIYIVALKGTEQECIAWCENLYWKEKRNPEAHSFRAVRTNW